MKSKLFFIALAVCGLAFQSCNDDDDIKVSAQIKTAFSEKYPDVKNATWEKKGVYYVADFRRADKGNAEAEAWFDAKGVWQMTETDIKYDLLPQEVKDAFEAGTYKDWTIDDIDMFEYSDKPTVYIIEVEKADKEYDLHYAADGTLVKTVPDTKA